MDCVVGVDTGGLACILFQCISNQSSLSVNHAAVMSVIDKYYTAISAGATRYIALCLYGRLIVTIKGYTVPV